MYGLGTIINVCAIIAGGLLGLFGGRFLTKRFQEIVTVSCGIATIYIGLSGALQKGLTITPEGLSSGGTLMMIVSLVAGSLIGEALRIEDRMEGFGEWLKRRTGNASDQSFTGAFVTASLTVCVGAMAIVGSIEDGIYGNHSVLVTKAVLDFIIILIMASSLGKGCIFSAVSVGLVQGVITLCARLLRPLMTEAALDNLSLVGSLMIFCVGINLVLGAWQDGKAGVKKIRVGNMLPGLVIAVIWALAA